VATNNPGFVSSVNRAHKDCGLAHVRLTATNAAHYGKWMLTINEVARLPALIPTVQKKRAERIQPCRLDIQVNVVGSVMPVCGGDTNEHL